MKDLPIPFKINPVLIKLTKEEIIAIRGSYEMTQDEFSAHIGVPYNTYISWENGRRNPCRSGQALLKKYQIPPKD